MNKEQNEKETGEGLGKRLRNELRKRLGNTFREGKKRSK